jgi:hypothetical protein
MLSDMFETARTERLCRGLIREVIHRGAESQNVSIFREFQDQRMTVY